MSQYLFIVIVVVVIVVVVIVILVPRSIEEWTNVFINEALLIGQIVINSLTAIIITQHVIIIVVVVALLIPQLQLEMSIQLILGLWRIGYYEH